MLPTIVVAVAPLLAGGAFGLYRLAFWSTPADRWSARRAHTHLAHITAKPGFELSGYENSLRAMRENAREGK
jgi:hypothetical protein